MKEKGINPNFSPTFCVARWLLVDVNLQIGNFRGCYLTKPQIMNPPKDKNGFFNTKYQMAQRMKMMQGKWPKDCRVCEYAEKFSTKVSDRNKMNNASWVKDFLDNKNMGDLLKNTDPAYLEVSLSNTCNMACLYCVPAISSRIEADIIKNGDYPIGNDIYAPGGEVLSLKPIDKNPYVNSFMNKLPEVLKKLKVFRITGGEPFVLKQLDDVLNIILMTDDVCLDEFSINTNLNFSLNHLDKYLAKIQKIKQEGKAKEILIYTSVDTWGEQAEYARMGLDLEVFEKNLNHILSCYKDFKVSIMVTYSALSVIKFTEFLKKVLELRQSYSLTHDGLGLDIPYLRHPTHLSMLILTEEFHPLIEKQVEFMRANETKYGFSPDETLMLERNLSWCKTYFQHESIENDRADFYRFIQESDRRHGRSFLSAFPELETFWEYCRKKAEKIPVRKNKIPFTEYLWME